MVLPGGSGSGTGTYRGILFVRYVDGLVSLWIISKRLKTAASYWTRTMQKPFAGLAILLKQLKNGRNGMSRWFMVIKNHQLPESLHRDGSNLCIDKAKMDFHERNFKK